MLKFHQCAMAAREVRLTGLNALFTDAFHLLHADSTAALRLWTETLTGILPPAAGTFSLDGKCVGVLYPRCAASADEAAAQFLSLAETGRCGAILLAALPQPGAEAMKAIRRVCAERGLACLHCTAQPQMSAPYDHVWQLKSGRLLAIR